MSTVPSSIVDEATSRGDAVDAARALLARMSEPAATRSPTRDDLAHALRVLLARTENIEAQRVSLLQQQAALRTVISSVPHFVFWKDRDCVYQGCNDIFAALGGLDRPEEIVGKTDYDMPWTKEQSDRYREDDLRVIQGGKPILDIEETNLDADGNEKVILTSKVPLQAEDGTIIGMLGIFADISARKQLEKELGRSKELAEAANLAKGDFLAAMSHELRTPLTLILGPLESLFAERLDELSAPIAELLKRLYRNAYRLKTLTDDILDFSKNQAGHLKLNTEPLRVAEHVRQMILDMTPAANARRIALRLEGAEDTLGVVMVDVAKLDKILVNLVGNALKFTPEGGEIVVSVRRVDARLELSVSDTGIGIEPRDHERLFRRFEQVDSGSKRRHGGTGLGLALVKDFVELMGGSVRVKSELGKGAAFYVEIPLTLSADQTIGPSPSGVRTLANGLLDTAIPVPSEASHRTTAVDAPRVVIAEDHDELRAYIAAVLAPEFRVVAVADGQAALDVIRRDKPEVVVSDVMMPVMDGFELVGKMKADPDLALIPIVLLTARAGIEASADSLNRGADDYLTKPFSPLDLLSRVRAAYRMKRLNAALRESERRVAMSERLAGLGMLLAKLSHELNNPLNVIYNGLTPVEQYSNALIRYAKACEGSVAKSGGDRQLATLREAVEFDFIVDDMPGALSALREASRRIKEVQSNLRIFLGGGTALHRAVADLDELTASSVELTRRSFGGAVTWDLRRGNIPPFAFDRSLMSQVLLNLLKNAWEAVASGRTPHGHVAIETSFADGVARIAVSDDGAGVPEAVRGRVFEAFFTTKGEGTGTGLGLAVSSEIVAKHGGRLYLDTAYERGARFVVELPARGHDDAGGAARIPPAAQARQSEAPRADATS
jgi:PAS domain S-box-containing protein